MKRVAVAIVLLMLVAAGPETRPAGPGDKVVAFARAHRGKQVGNGECSTLLESALESADALHRLADNPGEGDYVWGDLIFTAESGKANVGKVTDIRPGDLVQFRDTKFVQRDGRTTMTYTMAHHSAVVDHLVAKTGTIVILHQNYNNSKDVTELSLRIGDLKAGWIRIYRAKEPRAK